MRLVIVPGTNRAGSLTAKLAKLVVADYVALGCEVDVLEMNLGPEFLEPTAYKQPKPAVTALVNRFLAGDAAVFLVPEYNGSYPGILKLFVDMLPEREGFSGRPCAFIGLSAGQFSSLRSVEHFQGVAGYRNAYIFPTRLFIGDSFKRFAADGSLIDPAYAERLKAQAAGFVDFVRALKRPARP
ncbi:MAG: NAD(P)H-dependent oxidoreductase [Planctomycetes bacterium]|nr:NAD(P)H-dependent oxidoreductase [Planctomycetota bacterium]